LEKTFPNGAKSRVQKSMDLFKKTRRKGDPNFKKKGWLKKKNQSLGRGRENQRPANEKNKWETSVEERKVEQKRSGKRQDDGVSRRNFQSRRQKKKSTPTAMKEQNRNGKNKTTSTSKPVKKRPGRVPRPTPRGWPRGMNGGKGQDVFTKKQQSDLELKGKRQEQLKKGDVGFGKGKKESPRKERRRGFYGAEGKGKKPVDGSN